MISHEMSEFEFHISPVADRRAWVSHMSRQALGNAAAGILFLIVAIVDFTRDSSGIGVVFVVFAAVFLGLAASARKPGSAR